MNDDQAHELIESIEHKLNVMEVTSSLLDIKPASKESTAYKRYADDLADDERARKLFQFPRNKPYERFNAGELFRVNKTDNHLERLKREKSFLAEKFFPPFDLLEGNLKALFADRKLYSEGETP